MHTNTLFSPQLPQAVQTRSEPFRTVISLCVHVFCSPEIGKGRGNSVFRCSTDGELPSTTFAGSSAGGVVIPVEGSEEDSKGEGAPVEDVDAEEQDTAAEGFAPTAEGVGEQSMLRAERLETESRLGRHCDAESRGLGPSDVNALRREDLLFATGALARLFEGELPGAKGLHNQAIADSRL